MSIAEKLVTIAENEQKVYKAGQLKTLQDSEYMNAKVSGTTITVNDVSPIEHSVGCKLSSKNLIPFPYVDGSKEENGITFTNNGDGSITINGTATDTAVFNLFNNANNVIELTEGQPYTSNIPNGCRLMGYDKAQSAYPVLSSGGSSIAPFRTYNLSQIYIQVLSGTTLNNFKLYPMLNEGSTATEYTPYVADVGGIEVSRCGKNLCPVANITTAEHQAGSVIINNFMRHGTYTFSADITKYAGDTATNTRLSITVIYTDGTQVEKTSSYDYSSTESDGISRRKTATIETDPTKTINIIYLIPLNYSKPNTRNAKAENMQFEYGNTATPYTPYIEPTTHQSTADGTVEGITSISPNMTLISSNNGVVIDANYLRDIDTYINNLKAL